jgi:hypothetical protein
MSEPSEREHVHNSLHTLLSVSAADTFDVMADDCQSEEQSGASRRNILNFLTDQAKQERAKSLESGDDMEAEDIFREGFYAVLKVAAPAEQTLVLSLLLPLSSISGKHATRERASTFCRHLTESIEPRSSSDITLPVIDLLGDLVKRKAPVDPRCLVSFLANHGAVVLGLAVDHASATAVDLIKRVNEWTEQAIDEWKVGKESGEGEAEEQLAPAFGVTMVDAVLVRGV